MTLELNQVASQVKAMGNGLAGHTALRDQATEEAVALLHRFSAEREALLERITRAEVIGRKLRFDWVGAAPTAEELARSFPLPPCPPQLTVIASDGSQILPDRHAITLYYLVNVGCIVYRHGSNRRPDIYNPRPILCYEPDDIFDEQGNIISPAEVRVVRDMAELQSLADLAPAYSLGQGEPVVALLDGQLTLRVIDLPFDRQGQCQDQYIELLDRLQLAGALIGGYIDRPRSTFVLALLRLAALEPGEITEEALRQNPFRHLNDLDVFKFLGPGERSAVFSVKAKGLDRYEAGGHGIHFFYLNVSAREDTPGLARVEIPAWLIDTPYGVDTLHATLVRQARLTGDYPYVLARAHELAIISGEEREAMEMMLAIEMRRHGLIPALSPKQFHKNTLGRKESFRL